MRLVDSRTGGKPQLTCACVIAVLYGAVKQHCRQTHFTALRASSICLACVQQTAGIGSIGQCPASPPQAGRTSNARCQTLQPRRTTLSLLSGPT